VKINVQFFGCLRQWAGQNECALALPTNADVAEALAYGIRRYTGATLGLAVTGIAGPSGGTELKPVGFVHIALSDAQKTESIERTFRGDRQRIREWTTQQALDLIRRRLR